MIRSKERASLAVVVLNYRRADLVAQCLDSLSAELPEQPAWRVVVVDNDSGDGSAERIAETIATRGYERWAALVCSARNAGFSAGNNVGIRAVEAEHYVLLNSDTIVRPGALAMLLDAARRNPGAGLIGPRLEDRDGTPQVSCFRYATPWSELDAAAATAPISRLLGRYEIGLPVSNGPHEAEWISFACVLIRSEALREIGPLDEGFFMYFEDMDYCRRARAKGWRVAYEPSARVVHLRGGSSPVKQAFAERRRVPRYYFAARTRYFAKYYGGRAGIVFANLAWIAGRSVAWLRETFGRKQPHLAERYGRDLWTGWGRPLEPPEIPAA